MQLRINRYDNNSSLDIIVRYNIISTECTCEHWLYCNSCVIINVVYIVRSVILHPTHVVMI
jgi:hypothetical protein